MLAADVPGSNRPAPTAGASVSCGSVICQVKNRGEMPEWPNGTVSKTVGRFASPGFESQSLRQLFDSHLTLRSQGVGG